jgi:hypothetical protein
MLRQFLAVRYELPPVSSIYGRTFCSSGTRVRGAVADLLDQCCLGFAAAHLASGSTYPHRMENARRANIGIMAEYIAHRALISAMPQGDQ